MDSSHVSLCALLLRPDCFGLFRCDRAMSLGVNFTSLSKILKCAGNEDVMTMKAEDDADSVSFMFENPSEFMTLIGVHEGRIAKACQFCCARHLFVVAYLLHERTYIYICLTHAYAPHRSR